MSQRQLPRRHLWDSGGSGLSIGILNGKSTLQGTDVPESQKYLLCGLYHTSYFAFRSAKIAEGVRDDLRNNSDLNLDEEDVAVGEPESPRPYAAQDPDNLPENYRLEENVPDAPDGGLAKFVLSDEDRKRAILARKRINGKKISPKRKFTIFEDNK